MGDNTESDPEAYASIAKQFPNNIVKILIRNATGNVDVQKIESAFAGLDKSIWMVFNKPDELAKLEFDTDALIAPN